jgi:hypothetical protein
MRDNPRRQRDARKAFTLLETAFATIVIGVGVLAIIEAQQSFLVVNAWSTNASTATYLASEMREMSRNFPRHDRFSGGIYLLDPDDPLTLTGWGLETGEAATTDFDDLDDLDGLVFGAAANYPDGFVPTRIFDGPINAFGDVLNEMLWDGTVESQTVNDSEIPVAMRGWTQIIEVDKLSPTDFSEIVDTAIYEETAGEITRAVDEYPVRVRVTVLYQGPFDNEASPVTSVTWVVPR